LGGLDAEAAEADALARVEVPWQWRKKSENGEGGEAWEPWLCGGGGGGCNLWQWCVVWRRRGQMVRAAAAADAGGGSDAGPWAGRNGIPVGVKAAFRFARSGEFGAGGGGNSSGKR